MRFSINRISMWFRLVSIYEVVSAIVTGQASFSYLPNDLELFSATWEDCTAASAHTCKRSLHYFPCRGAMEQTLIEPSARACLLHRSWVICRHSTWGAAASATWETSARKPENHALISDRRANRLWWTRFLTMKICDNLDNSVLHKKPSLSCHPQTDPSSSLAARRDDFAAENWPFISNTWQRQPTHRKQAPHFCTALVITSSSAVWKVGRQSCRESNRKRGRPGSCTALCHSPKKVRRGRNPATRFHLEPHDQQGSNRGERTVTRDVWKDALLQTCR